MATKADVVSIARQAVAQRKAGDSSWTCRSVNGREIVPVTFDLVAGGYCARFVRQCHDAALGQGEWVWAYKSPTAWDMERALKAAGLATTSPKPGDIMCINGAGGPPGHIGIYLGDGQFAENTSSGSRGDPRDPGTKISPISAVADRVTGCYACLPAAAPSGYEAGPVITLVDGDRKPDGWMAQEPDVHCIHATRGLLEAMGYLVEYDAPTRTLTCWSKGIKP